MTARNLRHSRRRLGLLLSLALSVATGGCTAIDYDERVNGMDIVVDVDDVFSVSLPYPGQTGFTRSRPEIAGQAIRFLDRGIDASRGREWFKFGAQGAGEATLSISSGETADAPPRREYSLHVTVRRWEW